MGKTLKDYRACLSMKNTKKDFISHYDERFFTVEFYHGERGCFTGGLNAVQALYVQVNVNLRGGTCYIFPDSFGDKAWKMIDKREREIRGRIESDYFIGKMKEIISEQREIEKQNEREALN